MFVTVLQYARIDGGDLLAHLPCGAIKTYENGNQQHWEYPTLDGCSVAAVKMTPGIAVQMILGNLNTFGGSDPERVIHSLRGSQLLYAQEFDAPGSQNSWHKASRVLPISSHYPMSVRLCVQALMQHLGLALI